MYFSFPPYITCYNFTQFHTLYLLILPYFYSNLAEAKSESTSCDKVPINHIVNMYHSDNNHIFWTIIDMSDWCAHSITQTQMLALHKLVYLRKMFPLKLSLQIKPFDKGIKHGKCHLLQMILQTTDQKYNDRHLVSSLVGDKLSVLTSLYSLYSHVVRLPRLHICGTS